MFLVMFKRFPYHSPTISGEFFGGGLGPQRRHTTTSRWMRHLILRNAQGLNQAWPALLHLKSEKSEWELQGWAGYLYESEEMELWSCVWVDRFLKLKRKVYIYIYVKSVHIPIDLISIWKINHIYVPTLSTCPCTISASYKQQKRNSTCVGVNSSTPQHDFP